MRIGTRPKIPLWRVPVQTAQLLPVSAYFLAALVSYFLLPLLGLGLGILNKTFCDYQIACPYSDPIDTMLGGVAVVMLLSFVFSWIAFLIALPVALFLRSFGFIGILPPIIFSALFTEIMLAQLTKDPLDAPFMRSGTIQMNIDPAMVAAWTQWFLLHAGAQTLSAGFALTFWFTLYFFWPQAFRCSSE